MQASDGRSLFDHQADRFQTAKVFEGPEFLQLHKSSRAISKILTRRRLQLMVVKRPRKHPYAPKLKNTKTL